MGGLTDLVGILPCQATEGRGVTLTCTNCLSQITAEEKNGRIEFSCRGGCSQDEIINSLADAEPRFADWLLSGGLQAASAGPSGASQSHVSDNGEGKANGQGTDDRHRLRAEANRPGQLDSTIAGVQSGKGPSAHVGGGIESHHKGGSQNALEGERNDGRGIEEEIRRAGHADSEIVRGDDCNSRSLHDNSGGRSLSLENAKPAETGGPNGLSQGVGERGNGQLQDGIISSNGQVVRRQPDVFSWKMMLYELGKVACDKAITKNQLTRADIGAMDEETFVATIEKLRNNPQYWQTSDPAGLSETEISEEVWALARALRKNYAPVPVEQPKVPARRLSVVCEDAEEAEVSNAEYLSRSALVDRLLYTHHASLHVGGKHEGKTTAAKTEALAMAVGGIRLYDREIVQTPVIYAASEDEYPSVRMDLLAMGWKEHKAPLKMLRIADDADRDFVLEDIAAMALKMGAYMVFLDMLFDFTQIQDELKYAETRKATGKVVQLAAVIKGHVKATHHSPKWMPDAASAAKAALGSQGIAARFSPIVLSRMWVEPKGDRPGVYTIESTMTRDPRGLALSPTLMTKDYHGWAKSDGEFKNWMKWPVYAQRIQDFFEMAEPGKRFSVNTVSKELAIPRPECQNAMMRMTEGNKPVLERMKKVIGQGGGYTYALIGKDLL